MYCKAHHPFRVFLFANALHLISLSLQTAGPKLLFPVADSPHPRPTSVPGCVGKQDFQLLLAVHHDGCHGGICRGSYRPVLPIPRNHHRSSMLRSICFEEKRKSRLSSYSLRALLPYFFFQLKPCLVLDLRQNCQFRQAFCFFSLPPPGPSGPFIAFLVFLPGLM